MLVVETIGRIRRAYFIEGKTIRAICRDLEVSRTVVRKVLRLGATEFRYERSGQPMPRIWTVEGPPRSVVGGKWREAGS